MSAESKKETILVAEDELMNREILTGLLSDDYNVLQACDGEQALEVVRNCGQKISCIILDVVMPKMGGMEFMKALNEIQGEEHIPIIVATADRDKKVEEAALELGAWDFVQKPYNPRIIKIRVKNAILRSQYSAYKELKFLAEYDSLTGIYNKTKFFSKSRQFIDEHPDKKLALIRFDIDRFQLVNNFFGEHAGDNLLIFVAEYFRDVLHLGDNGVYGRIYADIFGLVVKYHNRETLTEFIKGGQEYFKQFNKDFDISVTVGVYCIEDRDIPVSEMLDRATIAAKPYKNNYIDTIGFYSDEMTKRLEHEQEIINEMNSALTENQFQFYLQPKYALSTNTACGAEALVRWIHPEKGMISPGAFIPIFEKNGFISKLDYYMWEAICKYLRTEINEGRKPFPISVNISRINMYNPHIVEIICELIERYEIPASLLQLEVTESAYMDNPETMKKTIRQLQAKGFAILMDDFGNGYSSLSVLKDVNVDILKIDMAFMQESELSAGRSESVLASIIRMAKWLNIPVIAEGVERSDQVEFLRSVGCEYIQGYYFGRPMPGSQYNELLVHNEPKDVLPLKDMELDVNSIWRSNADMELLFDTAVQPTCLYSFDGTAVEILRLNKAFEGLFGPAEKLIACNSLKRIFEEDLPYVLDAIRECSNTYKSADCEYRIRTIKGKVMWVHQRIQLVTTVGNQKIFCGSFMNISFQKELESKLKRIEAAVERSDKTLNKMLIVDDDETTCQILKEIFSDNYELCFAADGKSGLEYFAENKDSLAVVLLDMIMPGMSGKEFLEAKKKISGADDVPVIVISADTSQETQIEMLEAGANDYITKPFFRELVMCRVNNVLQYSSRFRMMVRENSLEN